jgi:serine acetyltransferase
MATGQNLARQDVDLVYTKEVLYTGKTLAGVDINEPLRIGYPLALDHANITAGKEQQLVGTRATKPESGNVEFPVGYITRLSNPSNPTLPQMVTVGFGGNVKVWTNSSVTKYASVCAFAAGWNAVIDDLVPSSTNLDPGVLFTIVGHFAETVDRSGTAGLALARLRPGQFVN